MRSGHSKLHPTLRTSGLFVLTCRHGTPMPNYTVLMNTKGEGIHYAHYVLRLNLHRSYVLRCDGVFDSQDPPVNHPDPLFKVMYSDLPCVLWAHLERYDLDAYNALKKHNVAILLGAMHQYNHDCRLINSGLYSPMSGFSAGGEHSEQWFGMLKHLVERTKTMSHNNFIDTLCSEADIRIEETQSKYHEWVERALSNATRKSFESERELIALLSKDPTGEIKKKIESDGYDANGNLVYFINLLKILRKKKARTSKRFIKGANHITSDLFPAILVLHQALQMFPTPALAFPNRFAKFTDTENISVNDVNDEVCEFWKNELHKLIYAYINRIRKLTGKSAQRKRDEMKAWTEHHLVLTKTMLDKSIDPPTSNNNITLFADDSDEVETVKDGLKELFEKYSSLQLRASYKLQGLMKLRSRKYNFSVDSKGSTRNGILRDIKQCSGNIKRFTIRMQVLSFFFGTSVNFTKDLDINIPRNSTDEDLEVGSSAYQLRLMDVYFRKRRCDEEKCIVRKELKSYVTQCGLREKMSLNECHRIQTKVSENSSVLSHAELRVERGRAHMFLCRANFFQTCANKARLLLEGIGVEEDDDEEEDDVSLKKRISSFYGVKIVDLTISSDDDDGDDDGDDDDGDDEAKVSETVSSKRSRSSKGYEFGPQQPTTLSSSADFAFSTLPRCTIELYFNNLSQIITPQSIDAGSRMLSRYLRHSAKPIYDLPGNVGGSVKKKRMTHLLEGGWLNDVIINGYLTLLNSNPRTSVYCFNSHFLPKYQQNGNKFENVRRWTKNIRIFDFDGLVVPCHLGLHWSMFYVNLIERRIDYYDSLFDEKNDEKNKNNCLDLMDTIVEYLEEEWNDKERSRYQSYVWNRSEWTKNIPRNTPQQNNGSCCGAFMCAFAFCFIHNVPDWQEKVTQERINPWFRRHIYLSIAHAKFFPVVCPNSTSA